MSLPDYVRAFKASNPGSTFADAQHSAYTDMAKTAQLSGLLDATALQKQADQWARAANAPERTSITGGTPELANILRKHSHGDIELTDINPIQDAVLKAIEMMK